jgi:hypothetical protein
MPVDNNATWEVQLARLVDYKAGHGDCKVPQDWAEDPSLASWVTNQRANQWKLDRDEPSEGMTHARWAQLTTLGFDWEDLVGEPGHQYTVEWEAQLARLAAYKAKHGDCNIPQSWAEDPKLGRWVDTQRQGKRKLDRGAPKSDGMTAERAAKLTALGFVWDKNEAAWEAQLLRLAAYKADHGNCKVPRRAADVTGGGLGLAIP